ncbi:MAG: phosphatidate cytidylyltransferase [Deltaproteobacteria bacterium CG_4_9_14_3_um_filter_44_9]|nr:MAG: phosphatidate cytidylyltransferase [Deltaproteobacteria bacterium CG06_land_8_20_14_3_00_44_19]PIZ20308.1 MAG: phosphatidate cytidylyltransferase [Deltaproteobacteria bacterium CG_4_10_14_0_8_um_filter_43_12]PJB43756.1 MAG: phosphatidate cytidylyltransferase [Deltaproteobacteria bacterium CG_4_9_14_3_um_filter_44_9]
MELKRWLTALFLIPLLILVVGYGSQQVFFGVLLVTIILATHEFYALVLPGAHRKEKILGILLGSLLAYGIYGGDDHFILGFSAFIIVFLLIFFLVNVEDLSSVVPSLGKLLIGIFYIGLLFPHLTLIRGLPLGKQWVFFTLAVTFMGDTASYYGGSYLGRHKLYPRISPGKTIEGSLWGFAGNIGGALIFRECFLDQLEIYHCLILAVGLGIMGQVGDLCESMIKRSAGVKDSGSLLPGHGGVLDRIDSILFSAPFLYYYAIIFL